MDIESLYLSHNELSGPIPAAIGQLTKLKSLNLSHNHLTGSVFYFSLFYLDIKSIMDPICARIA